MLPHVLPHPLSLFSKDRVFPDSALGRIMLGRFYRSPPCSTMYQQGFSLPEIPSHLSSQPLKAQTKRVEGQPGPIT